MGPLARIVVIFILIESTVSAQAQPINLVIDQATQRLRDDDRSFILQSELLAERDALAKAQTAMSTRPNDESRAALHRHMQNVNALLREIERAAGAPSREVPHPVVKATRKIASSSIGLAKSEANFWDPYNRAVDDIDFPTSHRKELP